MSNSRKCSTGACLEWMRGAQCAIYTNCLLSSWGDRMWSFAVGLYLVNFNEGALRLAAVYGFSAGISVLLLGGLIGRWVDKTPRLKVVTVTLIIQNSSVALCAVTVCGLLWLGDKAHFRIPFIILIIVLAVLARLASVGYKIAVEKDWIVVVAQGHKDRLANLNAVTRVIDLCSAVMAPAAVGAVMTFGSLLVGSIVISGWNVVSVFIEYALLRRVYSLVPRLSYKEGVKGHSSKKQKCENGTEKAPGSVQEPILGQDGEQVTGTGDEPKAEEMNKTNTHDQSDKVEDQVDLNGQEQPLAPGELGSLTKKDEDDTQKRGQKDDKSCYRLMFRPCINLFNGWGVYIRQAVVYAGVSLACLYMTVLGFDSITVGYVYSQGISESYLGLASGAAGLTGIIGAFFFTRMRKCLGLHRTGILAFAAEILCLVLAVASIWAPGSPFKYYHGSSLSNYCSVTTNTSSANIPTGNHSDIHERQRRAAPDTQHEMMEDKRWNYQMSSQLLYDVIDYLYASEHQYDDRPNAFHKYIGDGSIYINNTHSLGYRELLVSSKSETSGVWNLDLQHRQKRSGFGNDSGGDSMPQDCPPHTYTSAILFLVAIVASRIGLWMADLTVTQTLQEYVQESERGVVNGVQTSLNQFMDMIKFAMVILAPDVDTFGILALISFGFICLGGAFFGYHVVVSRREELKEEDSKPQTIGHSSVA